jgi:hypothetical protein
MVSRTGFESRGARWSVARIEHSGKNKKWIMGLPRHGFLRRAMFLFRYYLV